MAAEYDDQHRRRRRFQPIALASSSIYECRVQMKQTTQMACFIPFNNVNYDTCFLVFRSMAVVPEDAIESLKTISFRSKTIGCVCSSIFSSIHDNMMIWYGVWKKSSDDEKERITVHLQSESSYVTTKASLIFHGFCETYAGESRCGSMAARISTGDIVLLASGVASRTTSFDDISYACLAIFRSEFLKTAGATAGVCIRSAARRTVAILYAWKSLQLCYSWILSSDYRETVLPYFENHSIEVKYGIFRLSYVDGDRVKNTPFAQAGRNRVLEDAT